ncbi:bifunctional adenosylcobinamide kinase/adenosylcobinamide-phosphate guanylyltransferase [Rhodococcus sp. IEGM 1408]|uniref:bifunctional adenosylcobinamide kinase/adenosylcobinamide-phosphate guanylyltransferase n=1 Tax=Rhodococcus sp. IEGM 1408 TaxID=3082220 RepID=UPI002953659C|nr:bifunctional adenosylcobinamide kinase/adenosylcobinamide-phosphate guanylyltransferase [Rhodococcus sp. IEGM 1408]MDV7999948.1 bifunctional adenosylcobinamide kinase/adenosylcobinamide-phosphate guanylyltransferase [Rhodococcus sp. IEGM 1408]
MRILVTGGARSGKSRHAVRLLEDAGSVTFVAPGRPADELDDPDWARRVAHHRAHRPAAWPTVETADVAGALAAAPGPVLVDCLGTWLTATVDALDLWDAPTDDARAAIDRRTDALCAALTGRDNVILVTNEVGSGVVPAHRSGGLFRDLLGAVNQAVGEACDEVHLVVCGRVLRL